MDGKKMLIFLNLFGKNILNMLLVPTGLITLLSQDKVQEGLKRA